MIARLFLAHTREQGDDAIWITETTELVRRCGAEARPDAEVIVVPARDDYAENFKKDGGWRGWTYNVIARIDPSTRQPLYAAIVVPTVKLAPRVSASVGKATADIIGYAQKAGRPVLLWTPTDGLCRAGPLEVFDAKNWQAGWRLVQQG